MVNDIIGMSILSVSTLGLLNVLRESELIRQILTWTKTTDEINSSERSPLRQGLLV